MGVGDRAGDDVDRAARSLLARAPRPPTHPELFTSDSEVLGPGIHPEGPPMAPAGPAPGRPPDVPTARHELDRLLTTARADAAARAEALRRYDDPRLRDALAEPGLRVALLALTGTLGEPLVAAFPEATSTDRLAYGPVDSPSRVVGPAVDDPSRRVVNERYRHEHPALLAPSLVHALLWSPTTTGHAAEAFLHALLAMTHLQLLARAPHLARSGTELARRQNSLALTLLGSRPAGSARIQLVAPDGPGTIPGGAPALQSPDFWSIPFAAPDPGPAPPLLGSVLERLSGGAARVPAPLRFDDALAAWFDRHVRDDDWLPLHDRVRACVALSVLDPAEVAAEASTDVSAVAAHFGLDRSGATR